jgi:uncharacterized protein HemX
MAAAVAASGGASGSSYVAPASRGAGTGGASGGKDLASQIAALEKQVASIQKELVALGGDPKSAQLRQQLAAEIQAIEAQIMRLEQEAAKKNLPVAIPDPKASGNNRSASDLIDKTLGIGGVIDTEA